MTPRHTTVTVHTQPATPRARIALRRRLAGAHPKAELRRRLAAVAQRRAVRG